MTKEGSTKICKFNDPQGWGSDVRLGHISHCSEYVLSSTLSIYSTLFAIVLGDCDAAYLFDRSFSLFCDGAVDKQF